MARRIPYRLADGKIVPSVTTIIGRFKDSGALLYWANQQGLNGVTLNEAQRPAASAGTLAHKLVERYIKGGEPYVLSEEERDVEGPAKAALKNFIKWQTQSKITFKHNEVRLVSERYRFGGTIDAIGVDEEDGTQVVIDFKTGSIYGDHLMQTAAYSLLWNENNPDDPVVDRVHILSFKRQEGDFTHACFDGLEKEIQAFLQIRKLYTDVKAIERRAR